MEITRRGLVAGAAAWAAVPLAARAAVKYPNVVGGFLPIMETPFTETGAVDYQALEAEARREATSLAALVARVDSERGPRNLASALRVHVLAETLEKDADAP